MTTPKTFFLRALALVGVLCGAALSYPAMAQDEARFAVTENVVQKDLAPFTVTVGGLSNGATFTPVASGFEPILYRTQFLATQDSPDRVIASRDVLSNFDSLRSGALDGAEVDILRIENRAFRLVRQARVAEGGHRASGWRLLTRRKEVLAPEANRFVYVWPRYARPSAPAYFTVRAIDTGRRLSPPARVAMAASPAKFGSVEVENPLIEYETGKLAGGRSDLAAPGNLQARTTRDGATVLTWDAPAGRVEGYLVYISENPPDEHDGPWLKLEGEGPAVKAGDLVIVRWKQYEASRRRMSTDRAWNAGQNRVFQSPLVAGFSDEAEGGVWSLKKHPPDTPVIDPGETYLSLTFSNDDRASIGVYNHSGTGQSYYPVFEPGREYVFEVWMRGRALHPARLVFHGPYGANQTGGLRPISLPISPEWTRYVVNFAVPAVFTGRGAGRMALEFSGSGLVEIDNFRVYAADGTFSGLRPEDAERLAASGMGALRMHGLVKSGTRTYDLAQTTDRDADTLASYLENAEAVGMDPWLQIEPHFDRDEWLGLVEYLAAPYNPMIDSPESRPWAAKRARLGHPEPWTEVFDSLLFEIGNETWNGLFRPWVFRGMPDAGTGEAMSRGAVYGLYQEYVLGIMRQSPYWPLLEPKLVTVLGGWSGFDYGRDAAAVSPSSDYLTIAAYNGGWDEDEGPVSTTPGGYFNVLNGVSQLGQVRARRHSAEAFDLSRGRPKPLAVGTYEAGPGYVLNGLNGQTVSEEEAAEQELVMKSNAAGTATLDTFLAFATEGFSLQNFFTYGTGRTWKSHARWYHGGQAYPSWQLLSLFNNELGGDLLGVRTVEVPTTDLGAYKRRKAVENAPLVAAYVMRSGARLSVVLVSRRVPGYPRPGEDGRTRVTVDLPIAGAESVTLHRLSGDYRATNALREETKLVSEAVPVPDDPARLVVPELGPGQTLVYVFDGVSW